MQNQTFRHTYRLQSLSYKLFLLLLPVLLVGCETASTPLGSTPASDPITLRIPPTPVVGIPPVTAARATFNGQRFVDGDFDGDRLADFATFDSSALVNICTWRIQFSGGAEAQIKTFGESFTDKMIKGDFDGDGKADIAVVRGGLPTLQWRILKSSNDTTQIVNFGDSYSVPAPADYDGDGTTDIAVFQYSTGQWMIRNSQDLSIRVTDYIGPMIGYLPVPADYDGDGLADLAVINPQTMEWTILRSRDTTIVRQTFGIRGDQAMAADYDGDGKAELAVFRASTAQWILWHSSSGVVTTHAFGTPATRTEMPLVGNFGSDQSADIGLYDIITGRWSFASLAQPNDAIPDFASAPEHGIPVLVRSL